MKHQKSLVLLSLFSLLSAAPLRAQETAAPTSDKPAVENTQAKVPVDVRGDAGIQAVYTAQATPQPVAYEPNSSAQALLIKLSGKGGLSPAVDAEKGRIIVIGNAQMNMDDPTINPNKFLQNREVLTQKALLDARAKIIEAINTKFSSQQQLETPGTDMQAAFGEKQAEAVRSIEVQKKRIAEMLQEVDKAEAESLAGITRTDRLNAAIDAALKKLDAAYDKNTITKEKVDRLKIVRERYEEASKNLADVQKQMEAYKDTVKSTFKSNISSLANMPLFGSTCAYQTESYNSTTETYQISVLVIWSKGLEKATRAIVQGEQVLLDSPVKNEPIAAWIKKQNFGSMIGPRTYMDDKGHRYFIGISARAVTAHASDNENNQTAAELSAKNSCILSLTADVESSKQARLIAVTKASADGKESTDPIESVSKKISASIENLNINGVSNLFEGEVKHGLTGIPMYVVVTGVSPDSSQFAREVEEINYAAKIKANKFNAYLEGRKAGLESAKNASKNDAASYAQGKQDATTNMATRTQPAAAQAGSTSVPKSVDKAKSPTAAQSKTLDGAMGTSERPKDDF